MGKVMIELIAFVFFQLPECLKVWLVFYTVGMQAFIYLIDKLLQREKNIFKRIDLNWNNGKWLKTETTLRQIKCLSMSNVDDFGAILVIFDY